MLANKKVGIVTDIMGKLGTLGTIAVVIGIIVIGIVLTKHLLSR